MSLKNLIKRKPEPTKEVIGFELPEGLDPEKPTFFIQPKKEYTQKEYQTVGVALYVLLEHLTPSELERLAKAVTNPVLKAGAMNFI